MSLYILFIRVNGLNLKSSARLAELLKVENSISPDILGPHHIDRVIGTKFLGLSNLLLLHPSRVRTVIKAVETETYKLSRNILRNWVFGSKLIHEVQALMHKQQNWKRFEN